jgi:hypothetical protein
MNKLTEIQTLLAAAIDWVNEEIDGMAYYEDVKYLISLLEEKDKALEFYADEKNYKQEMGYHDLDNKSDFYFEPPAVMDDSGNIARKALNTSSNNEGDN